MSRDNNNRRNKKVTSQTRREPTGELMENEEIVRQAESNPFSARTRREPSGELMEEGRRQNSARESNFPTSARQPKTNGSNSNKKASRASLNASQPSPFSSSREDRREILFQSHRDFLELPMSQKRSLTELRTEEKISFVGRLRTFMKALAHEGIKLELPFLVLDHLAINELNFKELIFRVRRCASNGREVENDGIKLFKLRAMDTDAKEGLPSEEWMVILNCNEPEGNHAIYKKLNQERAYKSIVSAYAFDLLGCLDPDGCMSSKPLDLDLISSPVRAVVCPPRLIDYSDLYRTRIRERNENEKASTGYPRVEYRGHVILPPYFDSRPSTPQSLGNVSNMSEPITLSQTITARRVISDTTNSPTKKSFPQLNASSSDHTRKVVEQLPGRKNQLPSTSSTKENRSVVHSEQDQHSRPLPESTRPDVFERLGPALTPNINAKRFKADTANNTERSQGWEGPRSQPTTTLNTIEPQTRRESTSELMEDGSSKENIQTMPNSSPKHKEDEPNTQSELRSEPVEQVTSIQENVIKNSDDSQSMDYEFIENLFSKQLSDESNIRVSPEEVTIYLRLPISSSQVAAPTQGRIP